VVQRRGVASRGGNGDGAVTAMATAMVQCNDNCDGVVTAMATEMVWQQM